jgi:hypothetical protein
MRPKAFSAYMGIMVTRDEVIGFYDTHYDIHRP